MEGKPFFKVTAIEVPPKSYGALFASNSALGHVLNRNGASVWKIDNGKLVASSEWGKGVFKPFSNFAQSLRSDLYNEHDGLLSGDDRRADEGEVARFIAEKTKEFWAPRSALPNSVVLKIFSLFAEWERRRFADGQTWASIIKDRGFDERLAGVWEAIKGEPYSVFTDEGPDVLAQNCRYLAICPTSSESIVRDMAEIIGGIKSVYKLVAHKDGGVKIKNDLYIGEPGFPESDRKRVAELCGIDESDICYNGNLMKDR